MYEKGALLAEGKTKRVWAVVDQPGLVILEAKSVVTAGDGAKKDVLRGKAEYASITNANIFALLNDEGFETHFVEVFSPTEFVARKCEMILLEVVVRQFADGSYLKRNLDVEKGHEFNPLDFSMHYKDDALHDPLIQWEQDGVFLDEWVLLEAKVPNTVQGRIPAVVTQDQVDSIRDDAVMIFQELSTILLVYGVRLWDFKLEFGLIGDDIVLADVITNDEWRITMDGKQLDKQVFRDGGEMIDIALNYAFVAGLSHVFVPDESRNSF